MRLPTLRPRRHHGRRAGLEISGRLGHDRVFALPFAVQQDLHSPRGSRDERAVGFQAVFLGNWWAKSSMNDRMPKRRCSKTSAPAGLAIYDRAKFNDHERYRFPSSGTTSRVAGL